MIMFGLGDQLNLQQIYPATVASLPAAILGLLAEHQGDIATQSFGSTTYLKMILYSIQVVLTAKLL